MKFLLRIFVLSMIFIGILPASAAERRHEEASYLGTVVGVTICYDAGQRGKADTAIKSVWQKFADVHAHMNLFDPASDVSLLNASSGRAVKVHDDVYRLLEKSKDYGVLTHGAFDVTVGPLMLLWKQAGKKGRLPTEQEIRNAKEYVGVGRVELLGDGFARVPDGVKVDLGGNASGFVADQGADMLRSAGFKDFLIDAGGEVYAAGLACEGRPWRVGVNDPENKGRLAGRVELKDMAVSTSGSYEKYVEINGQKWPHIINPLTGYPERGIVSATVIAPHAVEADMLSTALCVLGPGPGFKLIEGLGDGYAAMIMIEGDVAKLEEKMTPGYAVFRVK